jgi:hypothetical protein
MQRVPHGVKAKPPDAGLAYDPEMTEGDEANVPEGSKAHRESGREGQARG